MVSEPQDTTDPGPDEGQGRLTDEELEALPQHDPANPVDRADVIGEAGRWLAGWSGRLLLIAAAFVVFFWGLRYVSEAIMPVLLALLLTSVLWPLTALLKRWGVPYGWGAVISLLLGIGVIAGLIGLIAPAVAHQWKDLSASTVAGIRRIQEWASGPPLNLDDKQFDQYISQGIAWLQERSGDIAATLLNFGGSVGSVIVTLFTTVIVTIFMLKDGHKFIGWTRGIVGRRAGFHASELLTRMWVTLSGYIRTQALVSFVDAVFIGLGVFFLGVPLAFPIAVLTFIAGFIPIVGAVTAGAVAVLVALVTNGLTTALLVLAVVIAVQQIEGHLLQPLLQSRVMQLHPVVVILAVLLGGTWSGIVGAFLAVPVAATGAVLLRYLGDLVDIRTGERTAAEVNWATDDGETVASESERSAAFFRALVRGRSTARPDDGADPSTPSAQGSRAWARRFLGRRSDKSGPDEPE